MSSRAVRFVLLASILPASGCGTVANLGVPATDRGGKVPFGGVRYDLDRVNEASAGSTAPAGPRVHSLAQLIFWTADLPFSAVGDLISYPFARAYTFVNKPPLAAPPLFVTVPVVTGTAVPDTTPAAASKPIPPATAIFGTPATTPGTPSTPGTPASPPPATPATPGTKPMPPADLTTPPGMAPAAPMTPPQPAR